MNPGRTYSMERRAQVMAANRVRVQQAVVALAAHSRLADISLADIAEHSGLSVRTLLRYYGTKDGLLRAVADELEDLPLALRPRTPDDIEGALAGLGEEYESLGQLMLMMLAQEDTDPLARLVTDRGKAAHRQWVCDVFELDPRADTEQIDLLVVSTDLYTWKLLRHDRGLSRARTIARMVVLVDAVRARFATDHAGSGPAARGGRRR